MDHLDPTPESTSRSSCIHCKVHACHSLITHSSLINRSPGRHLQTTYALILLDFQLSADALRSIIFVRGESSKKTDGPSNPATPYPGRRVMIDISLKLQHDTTLSGCLSSALPTHRYDTCHSLHARHMEPVGCCLYKLTKRQSLPSRPADGRIPP